MLRWWNVTKSMVVKSVVQIRSEWTRKVRVRGRKKVSGTQQIDRCWQHLKKLCPSQMKNGTGPTINARFWDRIYQWIYRHNMSKWDIASRCEMKKRLLQTFRRLLTKLLIWKMTKREAFWHVDVKNTRLCKSVLPFWECPWASYSLQGVRIDDIYEINLVWRRARENYISNVAPCCQKNVPG